MEKLIKKYFLNEGSKLVKVSPINNGQCDAWFEDEAENVQHRCVEHKDIERMEKEERESLISELKKYETRQLYIALQAIKQEEEEYDALTNDYYDDYHDDYHDYEELKEIQEEEIQEKKPKTLGDLECLKRFKN